MAGDYSIHTGEKRLLGIVDYVFFLLLFVASAAIGFYHAFKDRKSTNVDDFQLGGRKMHPLPVSLSLAATFMSALTILGTPAEVYTYGTMFYWIILAMLIATAGTAHVFLPVFYHMNKISCFGYIQMRFGSATKVCAVILFLLQTVLYMGFVLYAPSLALQAVTGLSLWGSMIGVASVCTLYTMLGGMKTVLWTDSLQFLVMVIGLLSLLIAGCNATGGIAKAWEIAGDHGRIEFLNVSPDPRTRHSIWSVSIGGALFWSYLYGINQAQVQRECTLPTLRRAQIAVWMNFPGLLLINTLVCMIGVVMFAFYSECDPVKYELVNKNDQLVPLMVLDVLGTIPGMSGMFMAAVFSGSLSSISSGLNAISAVILEDYIKYFCCKTLSGKKEVLTSKVVVLITGICAFGIAVLISQAGGMILELSYTVYSLISGPVLGCFIVGMIFPWTNKYGAISGMIISFAIVCWLGIGAQLDGPPGPKPLPVYTNGCYGVNDSNMSTTTHFPSTHNLFSTQASIGNTSSFVPPNSDSEPLLDNFYRMSYQWYTGFGMLLNIVVALTVSFLTGHTDPNSIHPDLLIPLFYKLCPCFPERFRKYLRLGVDLERADFDGPTNEETKSSKKYNVAHVRECRL